MMKKTIVTLPPEDAYAYINHLQLLTAELNNAMGALAGDRLAAFEGSVTSQEALCARLKQLTTLPARPGSTGSMGANECPQLAERMSEARATLLSLHRQYVALLEHCGNSLRLFTGLYRTYQGHANSPVGPHVNRPTWSCEL